MSLPLRFIVQKIERKSLSSTSRLPVLQTWRYSMTPWVLGKQALETMVDSLVVPNPGQFDGFSGIPRFVVSLKPAILAVSIFAMVSLTNNDESTTVCEARASTMPLATSSSLETDAISTIDKDVSENPLWPGGVTSEDVDELVECCLNDPDINIASVPDYIERQIYRSTIKLTLNAVYQSLAELHRLPILGHEFRLERVSVPKSARHTERFLFDLRSDVQESVLEQVTDRLMANKAINQKYIPDVIERQLYVNCLKIIFRLLDLISASFRLTFCGHDLRFQLEPSSSGSVEAALTRASSSLTEIDVEVMKKIARESGIDEFEADKERWFWQRMLDPCNNSFVANLHVSLYSLMLGVLDDLLNNTELELLSERILFDIVPATDNASSRYRDVPEEKVVDETVKEDAAKSPHKTPLFQPVVAFSVGVGVGLAIMSFLGGRH